MSIKTATLNGVATIEIARPEKKNAITQAMYRAMAEALDAAVADNAVRAVLLTGQPGIFTSGNDIEDFMQRPADGSESPAFVFMRALIGCDKPAYTRAHLMHLANHWVEAALSITREGYTPLKETTA